MKTYHHGDLRAAVLSAAGRMLEKEGVASLSVREAARRAGVSHNAPYRHFPDREALLAALAAAGFQELGKALENQSGRALGAAYVRFALANPQRFRLMFGGRPGLERHPELRMRAAAAHERFARAFAGLGEGAGVAAAAAWSLVHGLAQLVLDGHLQHDEAFILKVLGAMRVAAAAQRPE